MKKFVALIMALIMVMSLVACTNDTAKGGEVEEMTIKLTQPQPEGTPEDWACLKVKEVIEEKSEGKITVEYYPAGQIGSIPESIQSVQMGVTQLAMGPCAIIASYCEDIALVDLPYLLPRDTEVISKVMNDEIGREFMDRLDEVGIHGLGFWFAGFRQMTSNSDINTVADMKGLKMRIMESNILTSTYKALGAQPIVVAYAETYNALANGTVNAQENPAQSTYTMNFHEVQKYVVDTYHDAQVHILMANKEWFDGLNEATQAIIIEAEKAGREVLDTELMPYIDDCTQKMVDAGLTYHAFDDAQYEEFKAATQSVWEEFLNTEWRQDYFPRLQAAFEEASK